MLAVLASGVLNSIARRASAWVCLGAWLVLCLLERPVGGGAGGIHGPSPREGYDLAFAATPLSSWLALLALAPHRRVLARAGVASNVLAAAITALTVLLGLLAIAFALRGAGSFVDRSSVLRCAALFVACVLWGELVTSLPRFRDIAGTVHAAGILLLVGAGYAAGTELAAFPAMLALILPILGLCLALALRVPARATHR